MQRGCRHVAKMIERYRDGELRPGTAGKVREHLQACPACYQEFSRLERIGELLKAALDVRLSEAEAERLAVAVRQDVISGSRGSLWDKLKALLAGWRPLRPAVGVAVAGAVFGLAFLLGPQFFGTKAPPYPGVIVESVESRDSTVMIFRVEKTDSTIIWLFESPQGQGNKDL